MELEEIIPVFFENTREEIQSIQEALDRRDYAALTLLGHSLKGSSLGYGFQEMGEIGAAIENAARERKSPEELQGLIEDLKAYAGNVNVVYV